MNHNHANYETRLEFARTLFRDTFGIEAENLNIAPIAYEADCPFKYNNFVYHVIITPEAMIKHPAPKQPGCSIVPDSTTSFILRLTNPDAEGMNKCNRVENEVGCLNLISTALRDEGLEIVPHVYGWGSASSSQGWIVQEYKTGAPLDETLKQMAMSDKKDMFAQMARIVGAMQRLKVPNSVTGFGGLTYDKHGDLVSNVMTSVDEGPWETYEQSYWARLKLALKKSEQNGYIKGWAMDGLRERIHAFLDAEHGLHAQFLHLDEADKKVVVQADLTSNNILYDVETRKKTTLLDYDFSCVSHPSYEFLRSFDQLVGQFRGWSGGEGDEERALHEAKLNRFPSPLPPTTEKGIQWEAAKAWEDELAKADVDRPSTMKGIDKVADVDALLQAIMPWRITNRDFVSFQSEEGAPGICGQRCDQVGGDSY